MGNQQRAINVDVNSFDRHSNGYANNNYEQSHHHNNNQHHAQHAAILDGFDGGGGGQRRTRRSIKYSVKVRQNKESENIHWSNKKRFVPNGNITNFTPEFKPYRRPSYNAYLQAIKDRDKREDQTLEQFHRDRKYYIIFHANQWILKLKKDKMEKEQQRISQTKHTQNIQTQRGPNQSRSNFIYAQQMGINAT